LSGAFWEHKQLADMNREEWEQLCDGCAQCCLVKLEDEDSGALALTAVSCQLLDGASCRCQDYGSRFKKVPDCLRITLELLAGGTWLPETCAYRLLHEGKPLPAWHPLMSGDPDSVHRAGVSVKDRVISEEHVHAEDLEEYVIRWV